MKMWYFSFARDDCDMRFYCRLTRRGGRLGLSGILKEQVMNTTVCHRQYIANKLHFPFSIQMRVCEHVLRKIKETTWVYKILICLRIVCYCWCNQDCLAYQYHFQLIYVHPYIICWSVLRTVPAAFMNICNECNQRDYASTVGRSHCRLRRIFPRSLCGRGGGWMGPDYRSTQMTCVLIMKKP